MNAHILELFYLFVVLIEFFIGFYIGFKVVTPNKIIPYYDYSPGRVGRRFL